MSCLFLLPHDGHEVEEAYCAGVVGERCHQDVRGVEIAALRGVRQDRMNGKEPSALRVENAREDGAGIEARPAEPVERAMARDERGRAGIADQRIVGNRGVSFRFFNALTHLSWRQRARAVPPDNRWIPESGV